MEFSLSKAGLLLHHYSVLYVDVIIVYGDAKLYPNQYIMLDAIMVCSWFNMEERIHDRTLCRLMWPYKKLNSDDIFFSFFTVIIRRLVYFLGLHYLLNTLLFIVLPIWVHLTIIFTLLHWGDKTYKLSGCRNLQCW